MNHFATDPTGFSNGNMTYTRDKREYTLMKIRTETARKDFGLNFWF